MALGHRLMAHAHPNRKPAEEAPFMHALFRRFEALPLHLPYAPLGTWPTPIDRVPLVEAGDAAFYLKRDDISGPLYGGNKVRKLEFLLGQAHASGAKSLITFGAAGSNHCVATAVYGRALGFRVLPMLVPQPKAHSVRKNLLRLHGAGAEAHHFPSRPAIVLGTAWHFQKQLLRDGRLPSVIPTGGSSPLGTIGFVAAAFELKDQIEQGLLPEPERVYLPSGSMGSWVGLALGLEAAGLGTQVHAVRVAPAPYTDRARGRKLFDACVELLHYADPHFPPCAFAEKRVVLRDAFLGPGYAHFTEAGVEAAAVFRAATGIALECTYSAKAFACLLADIRHGATDPERTLFWNTYNSHPPPDAVASIDYRDLPRAAHRYFEGEVQPLDRD